MIYVNVNQINLNDLPSSTHIRPSSISLRLVGHAQEMRGLRSVSLGAGKHKCEQ